MRTGRYQLILKSQSNFSVALIPTLDSATQRSVHVAPPPVAETQAVLCDLYDSTFLADLPSPTQGGLFVSPHTLYERIKAGHTIILPSLPQGLVFFFFLAKQMPGLQWWAGAAMTTRKGMIACCKQVVTQHQASLYMCETLKSRVGGRKEDT